MSDLVLGLLVLGAVLFAGVLLYNRVQERAAQRAFAAKHPDALLDEPAPRREPVLHKPGVAHAAPHPGVDYTIDVTLARPTPEILEGWAAVANRFGRRAMLVPGRDERTWRAGLQLVSRSGVVSEAELIEFRSAVESLGASLGATLSAPEMRAALEGARTLDKACAESDIQVALHVIGQGIDAAPGEQPFQVVPREDGVTLVLDVAVTPELGRSYEAMARAGRSLADTYGARLVDDRGNALDERALAAIGAQLEAVRQTLAGHGIETGSPLALRLFS
ncbi:MAG TPA: cell division protein ZipA C-terminal FtsZ-binding domain-containing protein [Burkholderiales bacterium]|nr:cell division protein ZipA C-terminal FtsZ-binding domain-containing protein [Burkholderiales bacterium]